ncbi:hypothetical protein [Caballeronia sp. GAWG1-5s-s]|uniref:hypothetical protein n=1 Tax=Caballeronia sp. GAWG1-5s-s TaxID=2921743 RepID=UPI0020289572|nr:hypothetical protein [Caballeronia sp. GAWG1-5s-s]
MNSSISCCTSIPKVLLAWADNAGMNKIKAQTLLNSADALAVADVVIQYGHYDADSKAHGEVYMRTFIHKVAQEAPDWKLGDLMALAHS